jgi:hypothetical protein
MVAPEVPAWPTAPVGDQPVPKRAKVPDAPAVISKRTTYPLCGDGVSAMDADTQTCFLSAVVAGRRAELVVRVPDTGAIWLYRFSGHGAVVGFRFGGRRWWRAIGGIMINDLPGTWSFDPWSDAPVE